VVTFGHDISPLYILFMTSVVILLVDKETSY